MYVGCISVVYCTYKKLCSRGCSVVGQVHFGHTGACFKAELARIWARNEGLFRG